MFKRLKKIIKLSRKSKIVLDKLTEEEIEKLPEEGDGKGVFISEGTDEEYEDFKHEEDGTKAWYKRIANL